MAKHPKTEPENTPAFEPQKTKDGRTVYEITDKAPPYMAGRRLNGATEIALTDEEARAELLALHIRPKGMPARQLPVKEADDTASEASGEAASSDV
jgi:hypothetical protein